jgi:hypothetical protein
MAVGSRVKAEIRSFVWFMPSRSNPRLRITCRKNPGMRLTPMLPARAKSATAPWVTTSRRRGARARSASGPIRIDPSASPSRKTESIALNE